MKAILTVIGKDKVGIIAGVSSELQKLNINILDVNQTIMGEFFTMIMMLDLKISNNNFEEIKKTLELKGKELRVEVKIKREEIFNSMHTL
ncbi:ACT domain-containing protein [Clostridium sp.]|uniref:ACT domain-containing protein n=1 Tax=Clostridium sp. TaxID=1506 RepID=UPI0026323C0C|nr:ACT domain-containing protein [Clostridium sp.]